MADDDFLTLYKALYLEYYKDHSGTEKPTEFHLTHEDAIKLVSLAKRLPSEYLYKYIQHGEQATFPMLFGMKAVYGASKSCLRYRGDHSCHPASDEPCDPPEHST